MYECFQLFLVDSCDNIRFNIINHLIHWFKMVPLNGSGKGFKILNFKSIYFKRVLSLPIKVSLKKKKNSPAQIESQRKKRKGKGIEINKILLEDSLSLWI